MRHADRPTFEESIHVAAPPERIWPLVSDIALPVATSDELSAVRWVDGAAGPARAGRTFVGTNRNEHLGEWETTSTVVACDRPRMFAWDVGEPAEPNSRWRFVLEPDGDGTRVTQWGQLGYGPSGMHTVIAAHPDAEGKIVAARLGQWRTVARETLAAVKAAAEQPGASPAGQPQDTIGD